MITTKMFFDKLFIEYEKISLEKSIIKEYLAMILFYILNLKNDDKVQFKNMIITEFETSEKIQSEIRKCLVLHEQRMRKYIVKTYISSVLTSLIIMFLLIHFKKDFWMVWVVLAIVYFLIDYVGINKTISKKYDKYFMREVKKEGNKELLDFIQKKLEIK